MEMAGRKKKRRGDRADQGLPRQSLYKHRKKERDLKGSTGGAGGGLLVQVQPHEPLQLRDRLPERPACLGQGELCGGQGLFGLQQVGEADLAAGLVAAAQQLEARRLRGLPTPRAAPGCGPGPGATGRPARAARAAAGQSRLRRGPELRHGPVRSHSGDVRLNRPWHVDLRTVAAQEKCQKWETPQPAHIPTLKGNLLRLYRRYRHFRVRSM